MPCLVLPYGPGINHTYNHINNQRFLKPEAKEFRETVAVLAALAHVKPLEGEVAMSIDIYRPRRVGDIDGRIKLILDALQKFAYADDKQVGELHLYRYDDKNDPRCEVRWERRENVTG